MGATLGLLAPAATVEVINLAEGVTNVVAVLHRRPEVRDRRAERLGGVDTYLSQRIVAARVTTAR